MPGSANFEILRNKSYGLLFLKIFNFHCDLKAERFVQPLLPRASSLSNFLSVCMIRFKNAFHSLNLSTNFKLNRLLKLI